MARRGGGHRLAEIETLSPAGSIAFGLVAAACWGVSDFLAAGFTRKYGMLRTLVVSSLGNLLIYGTVYLFLTPRIDVRPGDLWGMGGLVVLVVLTYLMFYKALGIGPVSIVAPIVAAFAAVVVLLAYLVLGETLDVVQGIGAVAALVGVILASVDLRALGPDDRRIGRGVIFALGALVGFGITSFVSGFYAKRYGFLVAPLLTRPMITIIFIAALAIARPPVINKLLPLSVLGLLFLGVNDGIGFLVYARGSEIGSISIVTLASASYPLIPLALGLAIFKERIAPNQWFGIAAVLAGIALLSV